MCELYIVFLHSCRLLRKQATCMFLHTHNVNHAKDIVCSSEHAPGRGRGCDCMFVCRQRRVCLCVSSRRD